MTLLPLACVPTTDVDSMNGLPSIVGSGPLSLTIDVNEPENDATFRRMLIVARFASQMFRARGPRNRAGRAPINAYTSAAFGPAAAEPECSDWEVPDGMT